MAEEHGGGSGSKSGLVKTLVVVIVTLAVAAGAGFGAYKFVLAPRLLEQAKQELNEEKNDTIPESAATLTLPETMAPVKVAEGVTGNTILLYTISVLCSDEETKALVEKNKDLFISKFLTVHSGKPRAELEDPSVKQEMLKECLEEANSILRRLQKKPKPEVKVLEVLHTKFTVLEQ